ncbi:hypothetical protein [Kribbella shirazensis]|uniref:Uncharacterized protein n=1 Tax=Kribbella shirazensis TaxID=1105143 RepID=A0A7X5ZZ01_9ACTN|nr:hypothetical protein [Kribbella shirazensis]NIK55532.1 hypothetical protein [Kribbella shirazensis]
MTEIRDYRTTDVASWLRCRLLSFFDTEYYDVLDAWTRGDAAANDWYRRSGFTENYRYLHVYKSSQDGADGFETPDGVNDIVSAFMHAPISAEAGMRERFSRVHVCRQYVRPV